jgi:hypothetical protein
MDLGHAVDADRRRGIEPLTLRSQVTDGRDRVPADDQRPHVGRPPQSLGEHLRPAVEPDRQPPAVQRPAVAGIDDSPTAGRHHARNAGRRVGRAQVEDGGALVRAEGGLAFLLENLRDPPPGARLDLLVEVDERDVVALRQASPDDALAAAGEPDEDDVHSQSSPPELASSVPTRPCWGAAPGTGVPGGSAMRSR